MILANLKKLINEKPDTDWIILDRVTYIKLVYELYGFIKIDGVKIASIGDLPKDQIQIWGQTLSEITKNLE